MVILEAIGIASKEIFDYNRENFKFDQEQRLQKDLSRVEMQIKRFDLFRQDIEDLVKLTVDKMDMYHLIGALFLGFTTTIYCEGRVAKPPNWFNGLYLLTVASSFVYLLLAVWLSMHASISSHSFGVRLRTRYVRLPIPSLSQITSLTAKLSDFENQGVREVMRVPFATPGQQWSHGQQPNPGGLGPRGPAPAPPTPGGPAGHTHDEHLGHGEDGFATEDVMMTAAQALPGKHIHYYRRLQSKWQSYDAYARVSMAMGVHQMLNSLNYYMVGVNLIKWKCPTTAYACTLVFQTGTLAIGILDVSGWSRLKVGALQLMGSVPICIILFLLSVANVGRDPHEKIRLDHSTASIAPAAYLIQGFWFFMLLILAKPSNDEAGLPRKYRAVLYLDVFGDAAYDPTDAEHAPVLPTSSTSVAAPQKDLQRHLAAAAENALSTAQGALRRWEAVPPELLSGAQRDRISVQRKEYTFWRRTFHGHIVQTQPGYDALARDKSDLRTWGQLSRVERQEDEFAEALLGPLEQNAPGGLSTYHYDLENGEQIWEQVVDQRVLTLQELSHLVRKAASAVRQVVKKAEKGENDASSGEDDDSDLEDDADESCSEESAGSKPQKAAASRIERTAKEQLPWKIIRRMTSTLGACWISLGIELIVEQRIFGKFYSAEVLEHEASGGRRLTRSTGPDPWADQAAAVWDKLRELQVEWPHRGFFRPASISCLHGAADGADFMVGSQYRLYRGARSPEPIRLAALPRPAFPPRAVALCPPAADSGPAACLLGAPAQGGIAVWPHGGSTGGEAAVMLPLQGRPWRLLTGAAVRCAEAAGLLARREASVWCLLLAGWDGERLLVAAVPLPAGPGAVPAEARLAPRLDVPLLHQQPPAGACAAAGGAATCPAPAAAAAGARMAALHLDGQEGRLWVLFDGGALEAWDLYRFQNAGQWQFRWPGAGDFRPAALCTESRDGILLVGTDDVVGPRLLRVQGLLLSGREGSDAGREASMSALPKSGSNSSKLLWSP